MVPVLCLVLYTWPVYGRRQAHGAKPVESSRQSQKVTAVPADRILAVKARAQSALQDLVAYYESDEHLLNGAIKYASAAATHQLAERLARSAVRDEAVVISAVGSSVTAGHDGFLSTAWPAVLERRLHDVFRVEVRNQAVGGRTPFPASLCLKPIVGDDADLIVREWEYWSLHDGLDAIDPRDVGRIDEKMGLELFLRTALGLPKMPTVYLLQMDAGGESSRTRGMVATLSSTEERRHRRALSTYGDIGGGVVVVSAFGDAFSHLRAKAKPIRQARNGRSTCSGNNVGDCPLELPDGHHSFARWDGVGEAARPEIKRLTRPGKLFVNWHPGALGHEVIGNQLAYHLLRSLLRGLESLTASHPPQSVDTTLGCQTPLCRARLKCVMSTRPAASASVGALVDNVTNGPTRWTESPTDIALKRANLCASSRWKSCATEVGPEVKGCFDLIRRCSYRDQKRGFKGTVAKGPLRLRVPFEPADTCVAYLFEPGHDWSKPFSVANWQVELAVEVDGAPCAACSIVQAKGGYIQGVRIDVGAHRRLLSAANSSACAPAKIALSLAPLSSLEQYEKSTGRPVCVVARNGRCEPANEWRRYEIRCASSISGKKGSPCLVASSFLHRSRADINVFVESVFYF